jgi:hypothetical protein
MDQNFSDWSGRETPAPAPPRGVALLAGVVAVVLVVGVVGAAIQAGRAKGTANPVSLMKAAPTATTHKGTAHFSSTVVLSLGGRAGATVALSGETDFVTGANETTTSSDGFSSTIRIVAGVEYFQSALIPLPGGAQWVKILPQDLGVTAARPGLVGSGDPTQGLQFLGSTVGTPVRLGHETVAGTSVTQYSVVFNLASLFARVGQAGSTISPRFAQGFQALANEVDLAHIPGHVWLDSSGRVRKFDYTIAFQTGGLLFSEVETITFSRFGAPVQVTAPPAPEIVPFSTVRSEFAQLLAPQPTSSTA